MSFWVVGGTSVVIAGVDTTYEGPNDEDLNVSTLWSVAGIVLHFDALIGLFCVCLGSSVQPTWYLLVYIIDSSVEIVNLVLCKRL